jgi:hypothetical protein
MTTNVPNAAILVCRISAEVGKLWNGPDPHQDG